MKSQQAETLDRSTAASPSLSTHRRTALNCGNLLSFLSYLLRIILEVKETIFLPNICSFLALDLLFKIFIDL